MRADIIVHLRSSIRYYLNYLPYLLVPVARYLENISFLDIVHHCSAHVGTSRLLLETTF